MSGTWSRKRRSGNNRDKPIIGAPQPATSSNSWDPLREYQILPPPLQKQQQLLSRSTDRMFDEAQVTGILNLAGRKLKEFPQGLANKYDITDAVSADISNNRLLELPAGICELRSLESLRVKANVLRRVPSDIALLDRLTFLDFSNNHLTTLPTELFDLPIEILILSGNWFEHIPREIRQLSCTLYELDISCNNLKSIPSEVALLKCLRILNLRKNCLDQFPAELCRLPLQNLDLSSNQFTHLPLQICKMKTLVEFRIEDNPLVAPPAKIVSKGRQHIFKWMEIESGGGLGPKYSYASGTLRPHNYGRTHAPSLDDATLRRQPIDTSSVYNVKQRVPKQPTTMAQSQRSDSGYASTIDEHRISSELPSSGLENINETTITSRKVNGFADKSKGSPTSMSLTSSVDSNSSTSSRTHPPAQPKLPTAQPPKKTSPTTKPNEAIATTKAADKNANTINNNVPMKTTTIERKTTEIIRKNSTITSNTTKPVSKVAPLMKKQESDNGNIIKTTTTTTKITRPATKPLGSARAVHPAPQPQPAVKKPAAPAPTRPIIQSAPSRTNLSSTVTRPTVKPPTPPVDTKTSTSTPPPQKSDVLENLRTIFKSRLGLDLNPKQDELAAQLCDGIHLCNFTNALKVKVVGSVYTPTDDKPLPSPKAKRNVENFIIACRKLGVPESYICSAADITSKKNLQMTAKTILVLNKKYPV
ncbi:unnamed protein product, partial [Mesorhabditis spiculigera]